MRKYAQIHLSVWDDDEFRSLPPLSQLLYFMLVSHPSLIQCGVGDWRPARLARFASGWDKAQIEWAAGHLVERLFVLVDTETEEFLIRSYVRNDGFMKQPNMGVALARSLGEVGSEVLRGVIVFELQRLEKEHPELKGFGPDVVQKLLGKGSIDPSGNPLGNPFGNPSPNPSIDPSGKGSGNPSGNPSTNPSGIPSGNPSPTPAPTPNTLTIGGKPEGVEGVQGGEGETTTATTQPITAPTTPSDSSTPFATANADTRNHHLCDTHKHLDPNKVPPCLACKRKREAAEAATNNAKTSQRQARRNAINNCTHCDDNGMHYANGTATRCTHPPTKKASPF